MKKRLNILIITLVIMLLTFFVGFFSGGLNQRRIILAIELIFVTYVLVYVFGGLGKLVSSLIYGMFLAILLVLFTEYDSALIVIGTFLFVLNPLADFENIIEKRFPEEGSIIGHIRGSYAPYYEYRKEIKSYYHLPQTRKIYTKSSYLKLRQAISIIMAMVAVFLLLREVNNLVNLLKNFDIHTFFATSYSVIILVFLTVILYKKGFQSMLNLLTVSVFPPVAYSMYFIVKPEYLGVILGTGTIILGIAAGIYQYFSFRSRIVYEDYYYYDNDRQVHVHANALFEPFVYSDAFYLNAVFKIKTNNNNFNKVFHNIIVYADIYRFFITAYTYNQNEVTIYTDFHYNDEKRIGKFADYLESLFENQVTYNVDMDKEKQNYEKNFFHNDGYIIARTVYLAELLKKLEIKSNIIISMVAYFNSLEDINNISDKYSVTRIPDLDMENIYTVRIDMRVNNVDYIIESKVRDLLLELMINRGSYVRISVYY
ncbi:hypothetical protein [Haploplasma axanthum]|uniref:Uncharacterized protein n=1 Tax=Haploplasma axanthum TaxID=29552 RepID=A0A449BEI8_HAPAX|nr:hypothetical protein [Haploplasma axanthum]VEU80874.1 Uncharacterised protein [Haploplasma axanthum]